MNKGANEAPAATGKSLQGKEGRVQQAIGAMRSPQSLKF
jgi:hypothetical protein